MAKTFLFVPFSSNENNAQLNKMANAWSLAQIKHKLQFVDVLIYGQDTIPKLGLGDQIYILGHGVPRNYVITPAGQCVDVIINISDWSDYKNVTVLTPAQLASRLVESGLNPYASAKIKLFFCDEAQHAEEIAQSFMKSLVEINKDFNQSALQVSYYSAMLTLPKTLTADSKEVPLALIHKEAFRYSPFTHNNIFVGRASSVRTDLFFQPRIYKMADEIKIKKRKQCD